jgi:hypothetical protein
MSSQIAFSTRFLQQAEPNLTAPSSLRRSWKCRYPHVLTCPQIRLLPINLQEWQVNCAH